MSIIKSILSMIFGTYDYDEDNGVMRVDSDSGQTFIFRGDEAKLMADKLGAKEGKGNFKMKDQDWDNAGRGSFR
jgi:hypothetical protein